MAPQGSLSYPVISAGKTPKRSLAVVLTCWGAVCGVPSYQDGFRGWFFTTCSVGVNGRNRSNSVGVNGRGKLPRITQACGNKRFTASGDSRSAGDT